MPAGRHNFTIEQGATFARSLVWLDGNNDPHNLTGYSARMAIRPHIDDDVTVYLTSANGRITLGGSAGTIAITIPSASTAAIVEDGVYDLEVVAPGGDVHRVLQGEIRLDREVTR